MSEEPEVFRAGDPVIAKGVDEDPEFVGNVVVPSGGSLYSFYQDGLMNNMAVYAVEDRTTGEVRFFRGSTLRYDNSD